MTGSSVALYLRVSTGRQAEQDLSIPDQRRQAETYCRVKGWRIAAEYVEPGASATDERRPEFQRMMDAACAKPPAFDAVVVHSFSRFFRDHFALEFSVRRLAKHGVRLVSITQDLGDDPAHVMMRQIMALFDEYQSRENAKHTLRAMKENARQGYWNGARPPFGYRVAEAERRGARTKKRLEVDPVQAETVRLIFRLALRGDGAGGALGVKAIAARLNAAGTGTRDGARWAVKTVHQVLTRPTYMGRHRFNEFEWRSGRPKPEGEVVETAVPPIVSPEEFAAAQAILKARRPTVTAPRVSNGPTLLAGIAFCMRCGGAMTLRTGKSGRYRYYTCCTRARKGGTGCEGLTVRMDRLDSAVAEHLERRLLEPERLTEILSALLERRGVETDERRRARIVELGRQAAEADARLGRLYAAIEAGVADLSDPALARRVAELKATRDRAREALRPAAKSQEGDNARQLTRAKVRAFAAAARRRLRTADGRFRRDHLRALAQRVEVGDGVVRIAGGRSGLVRALIGSVELASPGVPIYMGPWRPLGDSNPCFRRERATSWTARRRGQRLVGG